MNGTITAGASTCWPIGLFGLAVGALTLRWRQLGWIQHKNMVGALVIALIFGGVVQVLAGITDIRYNEQLGGTALTMYGFLWITLCTVKLVSAVPRFSLMPCSMPRSIWFMRSFPGS